jgi:phosphohistidine phosphatase
MGRERSGETRRATGRERTIWLLRHAKSAWGDPALADRDRPLSSRGRAAAKDLAGHVRSRGIVPDAVLCSPARRARETLAAVGAAFPKPVRQDTDFDTAFYGAGPQELVNRFRVLDDSIDSVLVVGHNPTIADLTLGLAGDGEADALARAAEKYPTGGLATLRYEGSWSALDWGGAFLAEFVVPRDLAAGAADQVE